MKKLFGLDVKSTREASYRVAFIYLLVGVTWIILSNLLLLSFVGDPLRLSHLQAINAVLSVIVLAVVVGWIVSNQVTALRKKDETLLEIAQGVSVASGDALFNSLARTLALALDMDVALIAELTGQGRRMRTLALYVNGAVGDNLEERLSGPFERVVEERRLQIFHNNLRQQFHDHLLRYWAVNSFVGMPLINSAGQLLGLIALMAKEPIPEKGVAEEILPVFAVRAAVELDRRRIEAALRASEQKFSMAFRNIPTWLAITTLEEGRYIEVNDAFARMCGYRREEVIGRTAIELNIWADPEDRLRVLDVVREKGEVTNQEVNFKDRSDRIIVGLLSAEVVELNGEECLLSVVNDITERKQAEKQQARLAAIVDSSDDAIIGKTLEGMITDWNNGAVRMYGYSREEAVGKSISILVPPDRPDEIPHILEKLRRGERVDHYETVRISRDGRILNVSLTISPIIDDTGKIIGASTIAREITGRIFANEKLRP